MCLFYDKYAKPAASIVFSLLVMCGGGVGVQGGVATEQVVLFALVAHLVLRNVGTAQQYVFQGGQQRPHDFFFLFVVFHEGQGYSVGLYFF